METHSPVDIENTAAWELGEHKTVKSLEIFNMYDNWNANGNKRPKT